MTAIDLLRLQRESTSSGYLRIGKWHSFSCACLVRLCLDPGLLLLFPALRVGHHNGRQYCTFYVRLRCDIPKLDQWPKPFGQPWGS